MIYFSLNNHEFFKYMAEIYQIELTSNKSEVNVLHEILHTKIYDRWDDLSFPIANFSFFGW